VDKNWILEERKGKERRFRMLDKIDFCVSDNDFNVRVVLCMSLGFFGVAVEGVFIAESGSF
jgi:uncharacterized membrane protein